MPFLDQNATISRKYFYRLEMIVFDGKDLKHYLKIIFAPKKKMLKKKQFLIKIIG